MIITFGSRASVMFFFFQAEDGIRDWTVTGVQTCALPIFVERGTGGEDHMPERGTGGEDHVAENGIGGEDAAVRGARFPPLPGGVPSGEIERERQSHRSRSARGREARRQHREALEQRRVRDRADRLELVEGRRRVGEPGRDGPGTGDWAAAGGHGEREGGVTQRSVHASVAWHTGGQRLPWRGCLTPRPPSPGPPPPPPPPHSGRGGQGARAPT